MVQPPNTGLVITPACKLLTNATMALHFRPLE
jgi:hypothetical protein